MQAKWRWTRLGREIVLVALRSNKHIHRQRVIPSEAASRRRPPRAREEEPRSVAVSGMPWLLLRSPAPQHHPMAAPRDGDGDRDTGIGTGIGMRTRIGTRTASRHWAGGSSSKHQRLHQLQGGRSSAGCLEGKWAGGRGVGTWFIGLCTSSGIDAWIFIFLCHYTSLFIFN